MAVSQAIPSTTFSLPTNSQSVYVRKDGSDTTGTGSINNPFLTVNKALTSVTDASLTKPYVIFIGPGYFDESAVALKGNVYLQGSGGLDNLSTRIQVTGNFVTADNSTVGGGCRYGMVNINLRVSTGVNIDLSTSGSGGSVGLFDNCNFNGSFTYKGRQNGDGVTMRNCIGFSSVTFTGMTSVNLFGNSFIGNTTFQDSAQSPIKATVIGGQFNAVSVTTSQTGNPAPLTNFVNFFGGIYLPTLTLTQGASTGVYCIFEAGSYPFNGLTVSGGATVYRSTGLHALDRTPAVISASAINWQNASTFTKTLAANTTFTFSNETDGQEIVVYVTNTASNYTVTWPTVRWAGGVAPTQTIGAKTDIYWFQKIGGNIYGRVSQDHS